MGARAIEGKPGSGKSCYAVHLLMILLSDWARYKKTEGKEYPRQLYTNIPLDIESVNKYLSQELGFDVDLSSQIVLLDDAFFRDENGEFCEWWEKFPEAAYIVIDEFQFLLSSTSKKDTAGKDHTEKFMLYISKHRHRQHDILLLSQSIKNISVEARRQLEVIYAVLNIKNTTIGRWPFSLPMADVDIVRESWGLPQQMAHIRRGVCEQEKIVYEKHPEVFVLQPALFRLYKSVTMASEVLDRPSLKLGKLGSIFWLIRRHGMRLLIATAVSVTLLFCFMNFVRNLPTTLVAALQPKVTENQPVPPKEAEFIVTQSGGDTAVRAPVVADPVDDGIIGFVRGGVITPRGVLRKGDTMIFQGEKETIQSVQVTKGILYFNSGRKVQK